MLHNKKFKEFRKSPKNIFATILLFLMLGIMGTGFYLSRKEKIEIEENLEMTFGKVTDIYVQNTRGRTAVCTYFVDSIRYDKHRGLGKGIIKIGDSCVVRYSSKNHGHSEVSPLGVE